MPEFSVALISELGIGLLAGLVVGWFIRSVRTGREKSLINAGWQEQLNIQYEEVDRLRNQNAQLLEQVQQHKKAHADLRDRLESASAGEDRAERRLLDVQKSNEALHERLKKLSDDLAAAENKVAVQSQDLLTWQSRISPLVNKYREKEAQVQGLQHELLKIQRDLKTISAPAPTTDKERTADITQNEEDLDRENLQLIRGVGPAIEQTLHKMGIRNLEQIAELTAEDIHRVAAEIRGFSSRITRENWIGQAKKLLGRK